MSIKRKTAAAVIAVAAAVTFGFTSPSAEARGYCSNPDRVTVVGWVDGYIPIIHYGCFNERSR